MADMQRMTLAEFQDACRAQSPTSSELIVFRCPACHTLQTARELIAADAGKDFHEAQIHLGYSCIGRWTGARSPRAQPDGKPCNWTIGGFLQIHQLEVVMPDGTLRLRFELASKEEADAHRARIST